MLRKFTVLVLLVATSQLKGLAQDTSAYELQRIKINALLAERSEKFGQYDQNLTTRTGIFGFQTKRDIKNSNEILRQIALNDNAIFKEPQDQNQALNAQLKKSEKGKDLSFVLLVLFVIVNGFLVYLVIKSRRHRAESFLDA